MTNSLRIDYPIHFRRRGRGGAQEMVPGAERAADLPPRVPRLARLMALAIRLDQLVRSGVIKDHAQFAKLGQVSRARVSQVLMLNHLAPAIQEALLFLAPIQCGRAPVRLADLLPIAALADWDRQRRRWRQLGVAPPLPQART